MKVKKNTKKTVVIFVYSKKDAEFAVNYKLTHEVENVKILPGSLEAQITLVEKFGKPGDQDEILYLDDKNFYFFYIKRFYHNASNIFLHLQKHFPTIEFETVPILNCARLLIEAEFVTVLFSYYLYEQIQKFWKPKLYIFPNNLQDSITGWSPKHFVEASIIASFFCNPKQVKYYPSYMTVKSALPFEKLTKFITLQFPFHFQAYIRRLSKRRIDKSIVSSKIKYLFFSQGIHLQYYSNILRDLQKNKYKVIVVAGNQSLEEDLQLGRERIDYYLLSAWETSQLNKYIEIQTKLVSAKVNKCLSHTHIVHALFPKNFPKYLEKALFSKLELIFEKYTRKFMKQIALTTKLYEELSPNLVITTHDPGPSAIPLVSQAKKRNIPSLLLQHGFHDVNFSSDYSSTNLATWGSYFQNQFVKILHKKRKDIFKVGFPYIDHFFRNEHVVSKSISTRKNLTKIGFLVTLYQIDPFVIPSFFIEIVEALKTAKLQGVELWVRVHSGQKLDTLVLLANKYGIRLIYNPKLSLEEFIKSCDALYCWDTTAVLWVLLYKKPLFYSTPWWNEGFIPIKKYQVGWVPKNAQDFVMLLKLFLNNPNRATALLTNQEDFLRSTLGVTDGTSTQKHIELFEILAAKKR